MDGAMGLWFLFMVRLASLASLVCLRYADVQNLSIRNEGT
jgi:hypothetical protein